MRTICGNVVQVIIFTYMYRGTVQKLSFSSVMTYVKQYNHETSKKYEWSAQLYDSTVTVLRARDCTT